ncbi:uncharacterized protein LOC143315936 [Chaetodon auriga]|uniref:uncharacterized protein LOC143315936 n=1 Tax=Chaetodon auriga TaxID=39042 RepID=UPI004032FDE0
MEADSWSERRTVVVSGVPDVLSVSRMIDKLTIHFQTRRRSHGGDVEGVSYPTNMDGVAFVTFDEAGDAERVVQKEQHIMVDKEFPEDYVLTVFPFTRDVFLYVSSAMVDLSVFDRDQAPLIQSLRSAHRSLRFQPLLQQRKATIEGPFAAVQALREDLIHRASQLKSTVSAQTAAVELKETPLNTRVRSHGECVSSVSCSGSQAELEPASSNSLSTLLQTTGEATKVQTPLSNAKTQNTYSRQNVSCGSLAGGSFWSTDSDEEEQRSQSRLQMPTEYRTEGAKADPRQVFGGEINAGIRSPLSGLGLLPAEETSAKQSREDDISQKHTRPDRVSAAKIRGENHSGSQYGSTDYLKESDQSSSAVTAGLPQTRLKDVWQSSESDAQDTEELPAVCGEDPEDMSIFVDSYTLRYIERFDKKEFDRCLRGVDASVEYVEGVDLMQISLTEKRTSKSASRIHRALMKLSTLVDRWQSSLRVYQLHYDKEEQAEKHKLIWICEDVNFRFDDVLYIVEDSGIKVIGPSVSSHMFYKKVEKRIAKLKDKSLRI